MSECWHYIRFGTISDGIITGMHCSYEHRLNEVCKYSDDASCNRRLVALLAFAIISFATMIA